MLELFKPAHRMPAEERIDGENVFIRPPQDEDWASWAELRNLSRDFLIPWEPTWPADATYLQIRFRWPRPACGPI